MPALSAIYHLKWADIEQMPYDELQVYVEQLDRWVSVISSGAYKES